MRSASVRSFWNCSLSASHEGISTSPRSIYRYVTIHFNITSHISILFFLFSWDVKSEKYSFYEVNIYTYCFHVIIFIIDNMSTFNLFYEFNFKPLAFAFSRSKWSSLNLLISSWSWVNFVLEACRSSSKSIDVLNGSFSPRIPWTVD